MQRPLFVLQKFRESKLTDFVDVPSVQLCLKGSHSCWEPNTWCFTFCVCHVLSVLIRISSSFFSFIIDVITMRSAGELLSTMDLTSTRPLVSLPMLCLTCGWQIEGQRKGMKRTCYLWKSTWREKFGCLLQVAWCDLEQYHTFWHRPQHANICKRPRRVDPVFIETWDPHHIWTQLSVHKPRKDALTPDMCEASKFVLNNTLIYFACFGCHLLQLLQLRDCDCSHWEYGEMWRLCWTNRGKCVVQLHLMARGTGLLKQSLNTAETKHFHCTFNAKLRRACQYSWWWPMLLWLASL